MLAIVIALSNFNSFAQQIYSLINFQQLMLEAYQLVTTMFQSNYDEPSFPTFHANNIVVRILLSIRGLSLPSRGPSC